MRRTPNPLAGTERTYVRAGRAPTFGQAHGPESRCRAPARAARQRGAGGRAPRRSELRKQRRLLGASPRPDLSRRERRTSASVSEPGECRTRCVRSERARRAARRSRSRCSTKPSPRARLRSRSSPPPARARPGYSRGASHTAPVKAGSSRRHVLAVTFTRKPRASSSRGSGASVSTVGSRPAPSTRSRSRSCAGTPRNATGRRRGFSSARPACSARSCGERGTASAIAIADVAAEIEWAKARLITPDGYAAAAGGRGPPHPAGRGRGRRRSTRATRPRNARRHLIDFDDVLSRCAEAIDHDEEFAAGQRWRFRHLFVDEFQDATPLQLRLLRAWLGRSDRADRRRRSRRRRSTASPAPTPSPLIAFDRTLRRGPNRSCSSGNYRSTPAVVALAEVALGGAAGRTRRRPEAIRADGAAPTITAYDDDDAEARAIADACWQTHAARRAVEPTWRCCSARTRSRRASRPRSPNVVCRSASAKVSASRCVLPFGSCSTSSAKPSASLPGRPFSEHLAELAAPDDGPDNNAPTTDAPPTRCARQ